MVFRLGLNGLMGPGEEPSFSSLGFGVLSCVELGAAFSGRSFHAGNRSA